MSKDRIKYKEAKMKPLKLSIALAVSFAAILGVNGNVGNTDIKLLSASQFESMYSVVEVNLLNTLTFTVGTESKESDHSKRTHIVSCADPMDDLCDDSGDVNWTINRS